MITKESKPLLESNKKNNGNLVSARDSLEL
jgi:hypothetical protein